MNESIELRQVEWSKHSDGSGEYVNKGVFHTWGTRLAPQDNGMDLPVTVAIVEAENGKVIKLDPSRMRFVTDGPFEM